jgi:hypothetical protein
MNGRGRAAKMVAPDDPTVWVGTPSVYPMPCLNQDRDAPRQVFSTGWTDALVKGKRRSIQRLWRNQQRQFGEKSFSTGWTDAPSVHSVGAILIENFNGYVMWGGAPDEPMLLKSRRQFILRSTFQWAVSQRLAECLGLSIPPSLTHLRLLDSVEVQNPSKCLIAHP